MKNVKQIKSLAAAAIVALSLGNMANAATVHLLDAELDAFVVDASINSNVVSQSLDANITHPISGLDGARFSAVFVNPTVAPDVAMAGWKLEGLNLGISGDTFSLDLFNTNGSTWDFDVLVNGTSIGATSIIATGAATPTGHRFSSLLTGAVNTVQIKAIAPNDIPLHGSDSEVEFIAVVPVPSAALAGIPMLGLMGLRQLRRRRFA